MARMTALEDFLRPLTAYRFFLGIGIGGEYPAGSVGCAESTGELKAGTRNKWFIMFTNVQIDLGFVVAALVPMIVVSLAQLLDLYLLLEHFRNNTDSYQVLATTENHLRAAWRICLGLGVLPPLSLLYLRIKLQEPEAYKRETMANTKTPWLSMYQVLLVPPGDCMPHLVHLRLLFLFIRHLFFLNLIEFTGQRVPALEKFRLERSNKLLLHAWMHRRCVCSRHAKDGTKAHASDRRDFARNSWVYHGRVLWVPQPSEICCSLRDCLRCFPCAR
jgi:MFS family permease